MLLLWALAGCDSASATPPDAAADGAVDAPAPCFPLDGGGASDGGVSFSADLLPFFTSICANAECHGGRAGGLDLTAGREYTSLVGVAAMECADGRRYVEPGHPESSYIVDKLRGSICRCSGERMPLGGPYFTDGEIALFMDWIAEGAPNN